MYTVHHVCQNIQVSSPRRRTKTMSNPFSQARDEETMNLSGGASASLSSESDDVYSISSPRSTVPTDDPGVSGSYTRCVRKLLVRCVCAVFRTLLWLCAGGLFDASSLCCLDSAYEDVPRVRGLCGARSQRGHGLQVCHDAFSASAQLI